MREKYAGVGPFATVIAIVAAFVTVGVVLGPAWGRPGFIAGVVIVGALVVASALAERVRYGRFRASEPRTVVACVVERRPGSEPWPGSAGRGFFFPRAEVDIEIEGRREAFRCDWDEWRRLPPGATCRLLVRGDVICDVERA